MAKVTLESLDQRLDQTMKFMVENMATKDDIAAIRSEMVTKKEFDKEVTRLDHRIEIVAGQTEERLIGRMAEMEARIMREMGRLHEELMTVMAKAFARQDA
jgi:hypothetical protein